MTEKFKVEFLPEAVAFMGSLDSNTQLKIYYNIRKAKLSNDPELFKKITDHLWEFRTLFNKKHYRLFAFWDKTQKENTLVLSTHGLVKKTGRTPKADLERAEKISVQYLKQQNK